jgi:rhodanese-related sulfurtransferase
MGLAIALIACAALVCIFIVLQARRNKEGRDLQEHRITPEDLRRWMDSAEGVLVFDVRQPLDLLAHSEMIPGAKRIPPKELLAQPSLIPKEKNTVVYCTCPGDKTSREVLHRALKLNFRHIKFLEGGLAGWKARGYPVEPYREVFHLDTAT